jgi:hypothetical protein
VKGAVAALVAVAVLVGVVSLRARAARLRTTYAAEARANIARVGAEWPGGPPLVTDDDLRALPESVGTYLRRVGVVGKPRVANFHVVFGGRFRMARGAPWMKLAADQHEFFGARPTRLFFMEARRGGVPFVGYHRYAGDAATMDIRAFGVVRVVDARGAEMTQSETVTLFNDMCVFAPASLVDAQARAQVRWEVLGPREVKGIFTNAGHTISAVLTFDPDGDLVSFVSNDRFQDDGKKRRRLPWSTPLKNYREFAGARVAADAEARWQDPDGIWTYGEFTVEKLEYNVRQPTSRP